MPYDNVPRDKWDEMDACVADVQAKQGASKERAIKICYASIVEGVEGEMVPQSEQHYVEAKLTPRGKEPTGTVWDVVIVGAKDDKSNVVTVNGREYIKSDNKRLYNCAGLKTSASLFEGVRVFDNHLTDAEFEERGGMRSVKNEWLGVIDNVRWNEEVKQLRGIFTLIEDAVAEKLLNAYKRGKLDSIGLSMDTFPIQRGSAEIEGERMPLIEGFSKIMSVDVVAQPAAGGGFKRLIAATQHKEADMPATLEQLEARIAALEEALASREQDEEPMEEPAESPEEAAEEVADAAEEVATAVPADVEPAEAAQAAANAAQDKADEIAAAQEAVRRLECRIVLRDMLDAAKLPKDAAKVVREAFDGKVFKKDEVTRMIENLRNVAAARDASGNVKGAGGRSGVLSVGMNEQDWREVEFMRLLAGNYDFRRLESIEDEETEDRLKESKGYQAWIKAGRPLGNTRRLSEWLIQGFGDPLERTFEAATTSTLSSVVKNTVNIMLAADFQKRHQWWKPIVREEEVDTIDTATLVRFFGLSTLDVVEEGQAYTELSMVDEEETAAFVKRGNFVAITMETLLADKVNKVRAIPQLLADSWYNTHSKYVAAVFTTNTNAGPALADGGALFNATATSGATGHANLLTAALDYDAYVAARVAMSKQTTGDSGGGVKLLIRPRYLLVPTDLEATARELMDNPEKPGTANREINPWKGESEVIVVPEWTDTDNWALVADPVEFPAIYTIYYRGNRVPELYTSEDETQGAMFTNDTLRFKVRMLTFRYSSTYDCAPVSDFRPLHKNNVS